MAVSNYESVFIAEPEASTEQIDQLIGKIKQTLESHQGSLTAEDRWGRRRLAYPINKHREGFYSVFLFTAEPTALAALERLYNVTDIILRHLTVKKIKKHKKFAPRRERPAGAVDVHRGYSRPGMSSRPRTDGPPRVTPPPAVVEPPAVAAPVVAAPAAPVPEGEKSA